MANIFTGTLEISHDPIALWESYAITLPPQEFLHSPSYIDIEGSERAEDGFWRLKTRIDGPEKFIEEMFSNGLGRHVEARDPDGGEPIWEGKLFKVTMDYGAETISKDLTDVFNALWIRYRITGSTTTARSIVYPNAASIARYGRKEKVLNIGEIPHAGVADQCAQIFLDMIQTPKPFPEHREGQKMHSPFVTIEARGYSECWGWQMYNQTINTGTYTTSELIEDVVSSKCAYVKSYKIDANSTSVQEELDNDRDAGDLIRSCAKMGDPSGNRWLARMEAGMAFRFKSAAPATLPPT